MNEKDVKDSVEQSPIYYEKTTVCYEDSFVMYKDWNSLFLAISNESAGELIKAICCYQNGKNREPVINEPILMAVFKMMKDRFERDNEE